MKTVLVIVGVTHHNTLGMIRCVGSAGYRADLILVGHVGSFVTKSRYLDNVYYLDEIKELFSFLEGHYKECQDGRDSESIQEWQFHKYSRCVRLQFPHKTRTSNGNGAPLSQHKRY